ncbi:MAG TPA: hypothetical protein VMV44_14975 [Rectinemataceae bacterium]|nr:hypothetical protein [Rectinemataceae bacterium]
MTGRRGTGLLVALCLAAAAGAQETSSWFGGSLRAQESAVGLSGASAGGLALPDGWSWASATSLSAGLGVKGQRTGAEASFDLAALTGASAAAVIATAAQPGSDLLAWGSGENAVSLRLRTLWAKLDLDWAALQLGRQVVNYGRGALWSPEDIFARLDLSGATPDRLGADALRLKIPLGDLSGLDLVAAPTADPGNGRYATRLSGELLGLDSGILGAWDGASRRALAAADCKFDLGPSFYAEALFSVDPASVDPFGTSWARAVAGLDWSVGDFVLAAEYYWNGGGSAEVTSIDPSFPARQYLFATGLWSISDFTSLSLSATSGSTGLLSPEAPWRLTSVFSLDVSQNASLGASLDLLRGNFASMSGAGWTTSLGATLAVKF